MLLHANTTQLFSDDDPSVLGGEKQKSRVICHYFVPPEKTENIVQQTVHFFEHTAVVRS